MPLGEYLRELRDERDLSLREFAKKLDCSAAFISDVELGRRFPSEKILKDMATVLSVTFEELREHDIRPPIEEIKKATAHDPRYALAFRTVLDHGIKPDELLAFANSKHPRKKK